MTSLLRRLTPSTATDRERELADRLFTAQRELGELKRERDALQGLLEGNVPGPASWLMSKVARQRKALDRLHSRVVSQRFVLRLANELGHPPSSREFREALDALPAEPADRIDAYFKSLAETQ